MPKKLPRSRHASLHQAVLSAMLALFVVFAGHASARAQTSFEAEIASQSDALQSDDAEARTAAITYLRTLPREALPAIAARLQSARRVRPSLDEANTALTEFRRATGSRRADDLVDIADGVATVLGTTRDRATLKMAEPLLLLRSLEAMHAHEASMVMPQVFRLDGEAWRMESRRVTIRMGDDVAAAAIRARGDEDNAEGRAWARWTTERLGLDAPGTLVQRLSPTQLSEVLGAYGETHTLSAIPVVASFVDADHRRVREAAREGLRAYHQNGIWVARETYRTRLGEEANANWGWERTLNALYEGLDRARAEHVRGALGDALARAEQGELADAQRLLDAALVRSPELADEEAARLYARLADGNYTVNRTASRALFQRAIMLAPTSTEAARWRAEVLHLDAQSDLARGVLDADTLERAAAEATCTRCVETYARIAPQRALPAASHRPLALGAAAVLFALLGLLLLPLWSRGGACGEEPKDIAIEPGPPRRRHARVTELFRLTTLSETALRAEVERVLALVRAVIPSSAEVLEVGSTAVPGVIGKGDIDLLARDSHERFDALRSALDAHFERNAGQLSNATYQGYLMPSSFDVAIQCTVRGGPYDDFEAFLQALREDPDEVSAYNELKRAWDGQPMAEYRVAKAAFVARVLGKGALSEQ